MILRQNRNNRRLIPSEELFFFFFLEDTIIWNNIYPAEAHQLEQFRKVARKSEEVGPPCFRETSQHLGGTCKPATVSKGYRSTKNLGNPVLEFFKYFHILTLLLTTNNNAFLFQKIYLKQKL